MSTSPLRHAPTFRNRARSWKVGLTATAMVLGSLGAFTSPASAALSGAGPEDPANNFPKYYTDSSGLSLEMCQDGPPLCLAGPQQMQDVHAAGGDAEAFYFHASAEVGGVLMESVLEAAYLGDGADQEVVFQRWQAGGDLTAGGTYKFQDPFTTYTCTADAAGSVQPSKNCRFETSAIPGNFNAALNGPIGPFVTWDTFGTTGAGAPPAGYIGDGSSAHKVVGSPTGFNKMRIQGPGIRPGVGEKACVEPDGTTVASCAETDLIIVQGKVADTGRPSASLSAGALSFGDIPASPAVTKTLTYANTGTLPVTVNSIGVSGSSAAAFAQQNTCPIAPATLDTGTRCTISVTFTPEVGRSSAATLTITDDTPNATRDVALSGSNLGAMYVANPVPPAGLTFPNTSVGATSAQDNVVIGNSGSGPLTITSATVTGVSAANYKLGTNNTCTGAGVTVAPDGGCEIGVQFAPTTTGGKTASLRVTDSNNNSVTVPLSGTGTTQTTPGAPTITSTTAAQGSATVNWSPPTVSGTSAITSYAVKAFSGATQVGTTRTVTSTTRTATFTGLAASTTYTLQVQAVNGSGAGAAASGAVTTPAATTADTTAPTIESQTPASGATGVGRTNNITVKFSEPVNGVMTCATACATSNVRIKNLTSGSYWIATVAYDATTQTMTLNPDAPLNVDNPYEISLNVAATTTKIADAAGNRLAPTSFSFRTAGTTTTPATAPAAPTNVSATAGNASATVRWTAPSNGGSAITGYSVRTYVGTSTTPLATATSAGATATSVPVSGLTNGTSYRFDVRGINAIGTGAASALTTAVMPSSAPAADTTAPSITARTPGVSAVGASRTANITVTFNEAVTGFNTTCTTVCSTSNFRIRRMATGGFWNATITYNATTKTASLNPATLNPNEQYEILLNSTGPTTAAPTTLIKDTAGNVLPATTWRFTTGA